jgi:hypothetical protein
MDMVAAIAIAIALACLWTRWDEHRKLRRVRVEQRLAGAAGGLKDQ